MIDLPSDSSRFERLRSLKQVIRAVSSVWKEQGFAALSTQALEKLNRREFRLLGHSVPDDEYQTWISLSEPDESELRSQRAESSRLHYRPMISLVTPVWNPPPKVLEQAVASVIAQTYDNWELCVACATNNEDVQKAFRQFRDSRIKMTFLDKNLGICENSNAAIGMSGGEFTAFLDQDDILAPHALFEVAKCLNRSPDLDFIYSDMDRTDTAGGRFDPLFKPDWSPEILFCANYVVHLAVIRTRVLKKIGGFRSGTDRAQDWDLIFRMMEITNRIYHIPKILYHWRWSPISASSAGFRFKSMTEKVQRRVISDFMARNNFQADAEKYRNGCWRVIWNNPSPPSASIVIYHHNDRSALLRCIRSILTKTNYPKFDVNALIYDRSWIRALDKRVRGIPSEKTTGFAQAYNLGAAESKGDVIIFVDAHVEVASPNWVEELVGWTSRPSIGAAGLKLMFPDSKHIAHCGIVIGLSTFLFYGATDGTWSPLGLSEWYRDCSAVSGACLATRRTVFDTVGGFDENLRSAADIEYCLNAQQLGYRVLFTPVAKLILHQPSDHAPDQSPILHRLNSNKLRASGDPYYNPNLSYDYPVPRLR